MKKFGSLFLEQLKSSFNPSMLGYYRKHDKKQFRRSMVYFIIVPMLIPSFVLYIGLLQFVYNSLAAVNQQGALLALGTVSVSIITLVFGLSYVFTSFFGAKDMDMLLSMPIKPRSILSAKLLMIILWEYLFAIPFAAPIFVIYGINQGAGLIFWLYSVLFTLLLPVIPIAVAGILALIFVRLLGMKVNNDTVQMIFMIVTLAGVLLLNSYSGKLSAGGITEEQLIATLLSDDSFLLNQLAAGYFPGNLMAQALINYRSLAGVLNLLGVLAVNAGAFALIVVLAELFYLRALTAGVSAGKAGKALSEERFSKETSGSSRAMAIFKADFRVLLRTPVFAFNTVAMVPLMPVILFVSMRGSGDANISVLAQFCEQSPGVFALILIAIVCFILGVSSDTPSSFSREGATHWFNQVCPISAKDQLVGRLLGSLLIDVGLCAVIAVMCALYLPLSPITLIFIALGGIVLNLPILIAGLLIDLKRPMLNWENPAVAVKQNLNTLAGMGISMGFTAVMIGLGFLLLSLVKNINFVLCVLCAVSLIISYLLASLFIKKYDQWIQND